MFVASAACYKYNHSKHSILTPRIQQDKLLTCLHHFLFVRFPRCLFFFGSNAVLQVAEEAAHSREDGAGAGDTEETFVYPEERVVKLNPCQHVLYCCPSKDPTEQNCGEIRSIAV